MTETATSRRAVAAVLSGNGAGGGPVWQSDAFRVTNLSQDALGAFARKGDEAMPASPSASEAGLAPLRRLCGEDAASAPYARVGEGGSNVRLSPTARVTSFPVRACAGEEGRSLRSYVSQDVNASLQLGASPAPVAGAAFFGSER